MKNRKYWKHLLAIAICSLLMYPVPIVHGADQDDFEQNSELETAFQDEANIEIDTSTPNILTDKADIMDDPEVNITKSEKPTILPNIADYTCNDDIVFKFSNGTGNEALKTITKVIISAYENSSESQKNNAIVIFDYKNDCFSYDLKKGELVLKNNVLKESILIPGNSYCLEFDGIMMNDIPFKFENSKIWIINYIDSPESNLNEEEIDYVPEEMEEAEQTKQLDLFSQITDVNDHSYEHEHVLDLANTNTVLSTSEIKDLIGINQVKDVVIHTNDGVVFTFLKGSMKMIDKKETYDFGVELVVDRQQANVEMPNEDFVFRIKYNNTGKLPGTAQVSIPVGSQWAGQEVFYTAIDDRGILYMSTEIVDTDGIYTIPDLWFTL